jgi:hypothetical protein
MDRENQFMKASFSRQPRTPPVGRSEGGMALRGQRRPAAGYALLMVMCIIALSLIVLASTMRRTGTVARLNNRNNTYVVNANAAEAATEKVFARLAYDFVAFGYGAVVANLPLYRTNVPNAAESGYWSGFEFSDGQGNANRTYVNLLTTYSGPLPSQYPGLFTLNAPVYRVVSNARNVGGLATLTNAAQVDVLLGFVPISTFAIFYNSLLEFSTAAPMTVNGRVHANGKIYTGSSSPTTFNDTVTATGTLTSPANNGQGPWTSLGVLNGSPNYKTNVPTITLSINMTNTHSLIDLPPAGESATSSQGQQRMYNTAQVVLLVSNATVTARIQTSVSSQVPGADPSPLTLTSSTNIAALATNFPFLSLTNSFADQREDKTIVTTQIDVAKYAKWITTNSSVLAKFPSGSGTYPTILYAADTRANTASQLSSVRLVNGAAPPRNGGLGWSLATPNPLYVWGDYNVTNATVAHPSRRASTNTTATIPSALMSDALTLLSTAWQDSTSFTASQSGPNASSTITVNAAILSGIVPSTGNTAATFSGGVHNLPRLLENWGSSRQVWLNTSIINLFSSLKATGRFVTPGTGSYYVAPTRYFSFDLNFMDPAKQPPGMPCALVPIRYNWAVPPPNSVTYNVVP